MHSAGRQLNHVVIHPARRAWSGAPVSSTAEASSSALRPLLRFRGSDHLQAAGSKLPVPVVLQPLHLFANSRHLVPPFAPSVQTRSATATPPLVVNRWNPCFTVRPSSDAKQSEFLGLRKLIRTASTSSSQRLHLSRTPCSRFSSRMRAIRDHRRVSISAILHLRLCAVRLVLSRRRAHLSGVIWLLRFKKDSIWHGATFWAGSRHYPASLPDGLGRNQREKPGDLSTAPIRYRLLGSAQLLAHTVSPQSMRTPGQAIPNGRWRCIPESA